MTKVWQIAAGDRGRDYSALFLEHDLMFLGPSYPGAFDRTIYEKEAADEEIAASAVGMLEAFCDAVEEDDIVLLRSGRLVVAIGVVHGEGYLHDPTFDCFGSAGMGHASAW